MANNTTSDAVIKVNGQWASKVRYAAAMDNGTPKDMELRFMNGDSEVARTRLPSEEARELLGDRNHATIVKSAKGKANNGTATGELQGRDLESLHITLPAKHADDPDNAIERGHLVKQPPSAATAAKTETVSTPGASETKSETRPNTGGVPPAIADRFLRIDDKYYFPDRTLAFVDRGSKLKASTHNLEVVRSLVAIAQARGWDAINVTGTQEFRREVWREASKQGIEVSGYQPTELERLQLQRSVDSKPRGNGGQAPDTAPRPDQGKEPAQQSAEQSERIQGRLLDHGAASYRFDPKGRLSYFVKLQTDRGEKVLWGVDLERALVESQSAVGIGDMVAVENRGSQRVKVKLPKRDDAGNLVGEETVEKRRNSWLIEKPSWFERQAEKANAFREGMIPKQELVRKHPDLTNAVVALWLGEQFANTAVERPEDRARIVSTIRETFSRAVDRGDTSHVPMLKRDVERALDEDPTQPGRPPRTRKPQPMRAVHPDRSEDLQPARE
ncbi:hypothetical protein RHDC3_02630 [Rhodocyclaceae bacterium]|nr:hypothetical protein RHDC3_02630 [Rhodocyclaceae bacterium]